MAHRGLFSFSVFMLMLSTAGKYNAYMNVCKRVNVCGCMHQHFLFLCKRYKIVADLRTPRRPLLWCREVIGYVREVGEG